VLPWGKLPAGKQFGGTHGAISSDKAGNVYVSNQSETGVLVYEPGGRLVKTIAMEFPRSSESEDGRHGGAENHRAWRSGIQTGKCAESDRLCART
jgi:hypothetical protein